jgi:hypothetical protein
MRRQSVALPIVSAVDVARTDAEHEAPAGA